jgi:hypothetical protein
MAKSATKKTVKSATKPAKPGRRAAAAKPIKAVKASAPAKKSVPARAPVISKEELRAQLENAQATIASAYRQYNAYGSFVKIVNPDVFKPREINVAWMSRHVAATEDLDTFASLGV